MKFKGTVKGFVHSTGDNDNNNDADADGDVGGTLYDVCSPNIKVPAN